jgi:hypothetical protein
VTSVPLENADSPKLSPEMPAGTGGVRQSASAHWDDGEKYGLEVQYCQRPAAFR